MTTTDKGSAATIERAHPAAAMHPRIEFREVTGSTDWHHIQALREAIYVTAENRIGEETGFYGSFDRYNDHSKWFLAMSEGRAVGCVKVIRDSEIGLPYETIIGHQKRAPGQVIAEIGHLLSLSGPMSAPVVLGLMREILRLFREPAWRDPCRRRCLPGQEQGRRVLSAHWIYDIARALSRSPICRRAIEHDHYPGSGKSLDSHAAVEGDAKRFAMLSHRCL